MNELGKTLCLFAAASFIGFGIPVGGGLGAFFITLGFLNGAAFVKHV